MISEVCTRCGSSEACGVCCAIHPDDKSCIESLAARVKALEDRQAPWVDVRIDVVGATLKQRKPLTPPEVDTLLEACSRAAEDGADPSVPVHHETLRALLADVLRGRMRCEKHRDPEDCCDFPLSDVEQAASACMKCGVAAGAPCACAFSAVELPQAPACDRKHVDDLVCRCRFIKTGGEHEGDCELRQVFGDLVGGASE